MRPVLAADTSRGKNEEEVVEEQAEEQEEEEEEDAEDEEEAEYRAATEELFCRRVEVGVESVLPAWLAFLWGDDWRSSGRKGACSPPARSSVACLLQGGASWEMAIGSKTSRGSNETRAWHARRGAWPVSNLLVSSLEDYWLGPLRVLGVGAGEGGGAGWR